MKICFFRLRGSFACFFLSTTSYSDKATSVLAWFDASENRWLCVTIRRGMASSQLIHSLACNPQFLRWVVLILRANLWAQSFNRSLSDKFFRLHGVDKSDTTLNFVSSCLLTDICSSWLLKHSSSIRNQEWAFAFILVLVLVEASSARGQENIAGGARLENAAPTNTMDGGQVWETAIYIVGAGNWSIMRCRGKRSTWLKVGLLATVADLNHRARDQVLLLLVHIMTSSLEFGLMQACFALLLTQKSWDTCLTLVMCRVHIAATTLA